MCRRREGPACLRQAPALYTLPLPSPVPPFTLTFTGDTGAEGRSKLLGVAELVKGGLGWGPGLILPWSPQQPQFQSIFMPVNLVRLSQGPQQRPLKVEDATSNGDTVRSLGSTARWPQRRPGLASGDLEGHNHQVYNRRCQTSPPGGAPAPFPQTCGSKPVS